MGAGGSIPRTEAEALDQGISAKQIAAYKRRKEQRQYNADVVDPVWLPYLAQLKKDQPPPSEVLSYVIARFTQMAESPEDDTTTSGSGRQVGDGAQLAAQALRVDRMVLGSGDKKASSARPFEKTVENTSPAPMLSRGRSSLSNLFASEAPASSMGPTLSQNVAKRVEDATKPDATKTTMPAAQGATGRPAAAPMLSRGRRTLSNLFASEVPASSAEDNPSQQNREENESGVPRDALKTAVPAEAAVERLSEGARVALMRLAEEARARAARTKASLARKEDSIAAAGDIIYASFVSPPPPPLLFFYILVKALPRHCS